MPGYADHKTCLLHQKLQVSAGGHVDFDPQPSSSTSAFLLQMLNVCIAKKKARAAGSVNKGRFGYLGRAL